MTSVFWYYTYLSDFLLLNLLESEMKTPISIQITSLIDNLFRLGAYTVYFQNLFNKILLGKKQNQSKKQYNNKQNNNKRRNKNVDWLISFTDQYSLPNIFLNIGQL